MVNRLLIVLLVYLTRYMLNSKKYDTEWEVIATTTNEVLLSGWFVYLVTSN